MMPGVPYSGPCLPKDAAILGGLISRFGKPWQEKGVLHALKASNDSFRNFLVGKWLEKGRESGKPLGIAGVSFRPDFNEMRSSIALDFILAAQSENLEFFAYDPLFAGISKADYDLACRQDEFLKKLHENVSVTLERLWSECGVVFVNRKLDDKELDIISRSDGSPHVVDIYENELGD
jgi:UDP-glucose 6-dehydrogenase